MFLGNLWYKVMLTNVVGPQLESLTLLFLWKSDTMGVVDKC